MKTSSVSTRPRNMAALLFDGPNLITVAGFSLSMIAIFFAIQHHYEYAMIAVLWAVVADWLDGWVAGRLASRPESRAVMGAQLDSFSDLISSGVVPAILVIAVGGHTKVAVAAGIFIGIAGMLRLSFFNVYGETDDGRVLGLPLPHNILILALVFLFRPLLEPASFFELLVGVNLMLALLNIGPFYFPHGRRWVIPLIIGFAIVVSWALLAQASAGLT